MKSMEEIVSDLREYFKQVNKEGIFNADYVSIYYMQIEDEDGHRDILDFTFFNGEDRVKSVHNNLTNGYTEDLT